MKILITGGAGFIGSNLTKYLLNQGHEIIVVDNFFSGQKENIKEFLNNPKFKLIVQDIRQPLKLSGIDRIYHLAALASPDHYLFDPVATLETNVLGTKNILDLALKNKARILFTSTSKYMVILKFIPKERIIWAMLILLAAVLVMMKEKEPRKLFAWIIIESIK